MKQQKNSFLKIGGLFALFCTAFYLAVRLTPGTFAPLNHYTATALGFFLRAFGLQPTVQGDLVVAAGGGFGVEIVDECTAIFMFVLFASFVLAYPASVRKKAVGLVFGLPFLFAANTVRLATVFLAGLWWPAGFEYVHVYLWQTLILILVFVACLAWLHFVVLVPTLTDKPLPFFARFVAFASLLFLVGLSFDEKYILVTARVTEFLLHCAGHSVQIAPDPNAAVYPATFNLLAFAALILATQSKTIAKRTKLKALAVGSALIFGVEVVHEFFMFLSPLPLEVPHAFEFMVAARIANQYFLPFGLWLAFAYSLTPPSLAAGGRPKE